MTARGRRRLFWAVAGICAGTMALALGLAMRAGDAASDASRRATAAASPRLGDLLAGDGRALVFRSLDRNRPQEYGRLAFAPLARPGGPRTVSGLRCDRVAFSGDRGLCLSQTAGLGGKTRIAVLDSALRTLHTLRVAGVPSRARVSPDGRLGTVTTFVTGHSYAQPGQFSTQALILDLERGRVLGNVERFAFEREGERYEAPDLNAWGVTFTGEGARFYATMASRSRTWLIEGDARTRRARTLAENAECPSLSPDGTRVAYKKLVDGPPAIWRFHVRDLRTGRETPLAEARPVDDQIAWLDDDTVLYGVDEETWAARADGGGAPRRFLAGASSPQIAG